MSDEVHVPACGGQGHGMVLHARAAAHVAEDEDGHASGFRGQQNGPGIECDENEDAGNSKRCRSHDGGRESRHCRLERSYGADASQTVFMTATLQSRRSIDPSNLS